MIMDIIDLCKERKIESKYIERKGNKQEINDRNKKILGQKQNKSKMIEKSQNNTFKNQKEMDSKKDSGKNVENIKAVGIHNLGRTCYLNMTLQLLMDCDMFQKFVSLIKGEGEDSAFSEPDFNHITSQIYEKMKQNSKFEDMKLTQIMKKFSFNYILKKEEELKKDVRRICDFFNLKLTKMVVL